MNKRLQHLSREYTETLRLYLASRREDLLQKGYELGRKGIAKGLGVLDIALIHQQALEACVGPALSSELARRTLERTESFLIEMLSPFEAVHRGFREANHSLHQLNKALKDRNAQLAAINRELASEISERKRTERALRASERHYRQLFREASLMQERLRELSNQILHAQEEERKRISRELHDEVGQALTAISTNLAVLQKDLAGDVKSLEKKIAETQDLVWQTMNAVHGFARELRPAMLDELGLLPALRSYFKAFAERTGLEVRFQGSAEAENLDADKKTVLFRVAQESLTNVAKHAQASRVEISLRRSDDRIHMQVKDDGKSFEATRQLSGKGRKRLGLLGMQERVRLVNGGFTVTSTRRAGTLIAVEIPLKKGLNPGTTDR